ncbi:uncharacterized protein K452DRAFT_291035 [Aplosporella prunicola CBS 121167]|uniref:DUF3533 domain-containing protein n=1 Tax=Aplosporella prunicola CBS 121167 TaxID=1176127 RepID=A0A6A6B1C1_9PEZI|nr:uncharacterized protein K452DRAFT_291035 [Aplosporella prunicola CBS 121167]KAF2138002.1 hypothetical protein K452DRAFT_291035 [Aplosporella prunicola CBS 121167]
MFSFTKRSGDRVPLHHSFWHDKRKQFFIGAGMTFLLLQLLFLANMSWLYGVTFQSGSRAHNMRILMVDYDQGVIGTAISGAYQQLKADSFPTFEQHSATEYPTPADLRNAVCQGHYWGAVYSHAGASDRLSAALAGGEAASSYNPANTLTSIWNAVRYPTAAQGQIQASLAELAPVAGVVYNHINGSRAIQAVSTSDAAAVQALLNPIQATNNPIQPTTHGSRVLYNTVTFVMGIIMQFFFLMAINGIAAAAHFSTKLPRLENFCVRLALSLAFTFVASLCMTGYVWAFRENWAVTGDDFGLTWMTLWFYMHINYFVLDFATAFVPMKFMTFFVITWVILNISSTIMPFELTPGFYHWTYALPAHETYTMLVQIWSHGCHNREYRALPILFAWWIVGFALSVLAVRHRCNNAVREEEEQRKIWKERLINGDSHNGSHIMQTLSMDSGAERV